MAVSAALVGCQGAGTGQTVGTLGGAAAGAAIGSQMGKGSGRLIAMGVGALIGGLVGSFIGRKLDEQERQRANMAATTALNGPVGTTSSWSSERTGNGGHFRVSKALAADGKGRACKTLAQDTTWKDGKKTTQQVKYCKNADGGWESVG
ncbi:MAG: glycine zipper 2TM domain-containing protein [Alphaproteobacteria bacterium]